MFGPLIYRVGQEDLKDASQPGIIAPRNISGSKQS
jgi:hypothetical protein